MASIGDVTRPAFAYDSATDTWIPVGIGPHTHTASTVGAVATSSFAAKGDLLVGTGAGTLVAQSVGANGTVLTADSAEADGVKWATPAVPAGWSPNYQLLNAGGTTMSGSNTITISGISGKNSLFIRIGGDNLVRNATANATFQLRLNTDSGNNYYWTGVTVDSGNTASVASTTVANFFALGYFGASANSSYVMSSIQIDGTGTAGIKPITATTGASGGTATSSQSGSWVGSYNGTSAITSISLVSNGTFSGTGQVFVYGA